MTTQEPPWSPTQAPTPPASDDLKVIRNILSIMLAVLVCYLLTALQSIFTPLALGLFMAMLLQPVLAWFERKNMPFGVSLGAIAATSVGALWLCSMIITNTTQSLLAQRATLTDLLNARLVALAAQVPFLGGVIDPTRAADSLGDLLGGWLQGSAGAIAALLGDLTSLGLMTLIYFIVFLSGILRYERYLHFLRATTQPGISQENPLLRDFEAVKTSIVTYIKIKFLTCALHGVGYGLGCLLFGVEFWIFWGFLAFTLTFIPTIGAVIATIPPVLMAFVMLDGWGGVIGLTATLLIVHNIIGNWIEPKMMGNSLSLNTVTVLLGLVFWGKLWGITGMVLSVPLLVLTKVILSRIPDAQILVRLMSSADPADLVATSDTPPPPDAPNPTDTHNKIREDAT
jgi:AI-2 transport protein TqsA